MQEGGSGEKIEKERGGGAKIKVLSLIVAPPFTLCSKTRINLKLTPLIQGRERKREKKKKGFIANHHHPFHFLLPLLTQARGSGNGKKRGGREEREKNIPLTCGFLLMVTPKAWGGPFHHRVTSFCGL